MIRLFLIHKFFCETYVYIASSRLKVSRYNWKVLSRTIVVMMFFTESCETNTLWSIRTRIEQAFFNCGLSVFACLKDISTILCQCSVQNVLIICVELFFSSCSLFSIYFAMRIKHFMCIECWIVERQKKGLDDYHSS